MGYDAQRGYFVGLIPQTDLLIIGRTDGVGWTELARTTTDIDPKRPQHLAVVVQGNSFTAFLNGRKMLVSKDDAYACGRVGLRVVDTHAVFHAFKIGRPPGVVPPSE